MVPANDAEPRRPPMASFDATSSAVPDSLLLARQADRLARQATNTVMQDTISRPALGDSSNTLSVEALVKQGGRAKAPRASATAASRCARGRGASGRCCGCGAA